MQWKIKAFLKGGPSETLTSRPNDPLGFDGPKPPILGKRERVWFEAWDVPKDSDGPPPDVIPWSKFPGALQAFSTDGIDVPQVDKANDWFFAFNPLRSSQTFKLKYESSEGFFRIKGKAVFLEGCTVKQLKGQFGFQVQPQWTGAGNLLSLISSPSNAEGFEEFLKKFPNKSNEVDRILKTEWDRDGTTTIAEKKP